ncbi:LysR family transcriptional regulator [uncultured Sulfitobacter sp.]|uniref:LysR family transcriptional regulator n=1 Tax=uncultured Sulfitobacter sp. TaxID=191468 RepID=UPI002615457E|nr:LysR family transcriptional regulator [uncultured Sulfitobacter sp.]
MASHQTLRRLVYFAAIAQTGSIRGAAARLNLSVPVLSEALSELEAELGVSLATRTTRRFALTEAGVHAHAAAQRIIETAEGLTDLTSDAQPLVGTLAITLPVELAGFWLPERILAFRAAHPDVVFDIDVTDSVIDLHAGAVEVAIRADYVAPGASSRSSQNLPLVVVARAPVNVSPKGAVAGALIDSQLDRKLVATSPEGSPLPLHFFQTLRVTNRAAALGLARAGVGAVMVMRGSVEAELATGALVEVLPGFDFGSIDVMIRFRDRMPGKVARRFVASLDLGDGAA